MARRNQRVRVGSADAFQGIGVHAPFQGSAPSRAAQTAEILSQSLGLAAKAYDANKQKNQQSDYEAGLAGVQSGEITEENLRAMERSAAQVLGAERQLARSRAIEDETAMLVDFEQNFPQDSDVGDAREWLDGWMKQRYEGADAGIAREAAPFLRRGAERILQKQGDRVTAAVRAEMDHSLAVQTSELLSRDEPLTSDNWNALRANYASFGGDNHVTALARDVGIAAVEQGDESLLENDLFEHLRTNPATREIMEKAHSEARNIRVDNRRKMESYGRAVAFDTALAMAESGDSDIFPMIQAGATPDADGQTVFEQSDVERILHAYRDSRLKAGISTQAESMYEAGLLGGHGDLKREDEAAMSILARNTAALGREAAMRISVGHMVRNGGVPDSFMQLITRANVDNTNTWPQAIEVLDAIRNQSPGFYESAFPTDVKRQYEMYSWLASSVGPQAASERLSTGSMDPKLVENVLPEERRTHLQGALDRIADAPWTWNNVEETPRLRKMVEEDFNMAVSAGLSPQQASQFAIDRTARAFVYIDGNLFPANAGWSDAPKDDAEFIRTGWATQMGYDVDDVTLLPHPNMPTKVYMSQKGSFLLTPVDIVPLVAERRDLIRRAQLASNIASRADTAEDQEERAKRRLFPGTQSDPFAMQIVESTWNSMTAAERRMALDAVAADDRAAEADRIKRQADAAAARALGQQQSLYRR